MVFGGVNFESNFLDFDYLYWKHEEEDDYLSHFTVTNFHGISNRIEFDNSIDYDHKLEILDFINP